MSRQGAFFLVAAAAAAASLLLPIWGFRMSAPQYPNEALHIRVTRTGLAGDVHEVSMLQRYIGVHFPTELPELRWLTPAVAGLALLLAVSAFAGAGAGGRILRVTAATLFLLFLAASAAVLQKRLYDVGHRRDPHAPLQAIRDFTPPVTGPVRVGNFTVWSYPHAGAMLLAGAGILAIAGARRKKNRSGDSGGAVPALFPRSGDAAA